jgi:5-methylcytosine-specific restriction enzyme A
MSGAATVTSSPLPGTDMARRNPPWQRDELILALDLYFRHRPDTISKKHPEIAALSELLNKLPIHPDRPEADKFRNINGTYMKLCNFLALDLEYKGKGLEAGGRLERDIWAEFAADRERLARLAEAIRKFYLSVDPSGVAELAEEEEFPEGKVLYRVHRLRERNWDLVGLGRRRRWTNTAGCFAPPARSTSPPCTAKSGVASSSATTCWRWRTSWRSR